MAAFGLLAAGIAHEVGNPLAAVSSLVQMLQRREPDPYTAEKLDLAAPAARPDPADDPRAGRLLPPGLDRRLATSGRPRSSRRPSGSPSITSGPSSGRSPTDIPDGPARRSAAVRDHLTQVVLNLVLNAIDATEPGRIASGSRRGPRADGST